MLAYFTRNSKSLPVSWFDGSKADVMIEADENTELPRAWDAGFEIGKDKDGKPVLKIDGACGPGGYGRCRIEVPITRDGDRENFYHLEVQPSDVMTEQQIRAGLIKFGYIVVG